MHLRIAGSKIRSLPPAEGFRRQGHANWGRGLGFFSRWVASGSMAFIYILRTEHGFIQLGACNDPLVAIAELRRKTPYRLNVAYLGFTRADLAGDILQAAQVMLDHQRIRSGWIDCAPEFAIGAVQSAARRLGYEMVPTNLDGMENVLRHGSWVASIRRSLRRKRQGKSKALVVGSALGAMVLLGGALARRAPDFDPAVLIGPTILIGLIVALVALNRAERTSGRL